MRVSERLRYDITNSRVDRAKVNNASTLDQLSTLKRINKLSDDPLGVSQNIRNRDRLETAKQNMKNIEYAKGFIERSETAIQSISDYLIRAKELSIGLANDSYGAESRLAAAREVKEMIDGVVTLANAQFGGRYVFSGYRTQTPALSQDGHFLGDDGVIFIQAEGNKFRRVNVPGRELFDVSVDEKEAGHFGMIDTLDLLFRGLQDNRKDEIRQAMGELDFQLNKTSSIQASLGSSHNALSSTVSRLEAEEEQTTKAISSIEDADMFDATSNFKRTESILQSTLLAANKMLQPSLLNFMQ